MTQLAVGTGQESADSRAANDKAGSAELPKIEGKMLTAKPN